MEHSAWSIAHSDKEEPNPKHLPSRKRASAQAKVAFRWA